MYLCYCYDALNEWNAYERASFFRIGQMGALQDYLLATTNLLLPLGFKESQDL